MLFRSRLSLTQTHTDTQTHTQTHTDTHWQTCFSKLLSLTVRDSEATSGMFWLVREGWGVCADLGTLPLRREPVWMAQKGPASLKTLELSTTRGICIQAKDPASDAQPGGHFPSQQSLLIPHQPEADAVSVGPPWTAHLSLAFQRLSPQRTGQGSSLLGSLCPVLGTQRLPHP